MRASLAFWLQQLLQPCPLAKPGLASARRLRTRSAEGPHEGPAQRDTGGGGAARLDALHARGAGPLATRQRKPSGSPLSACLAREGLKPGGWDASCDPLHEILFDGSERARRMRPRIGTNMHGLRLRQFHAVNRRAAIQSGPRRYRSATSFNCRLGWKDETRAVSTNQRTDASEIP